MKTINDITMTEQSRDKKIANIIWHNPFFTGLDKLYKSELIYIVQKLLDRLDSKNYYNSNYLDERKIKDVIWDKKCLLIEVLGFKE